MPADDIDHGFIIADVEVTASLSQRASQWWMCTWWVSSSSPSIPLICGVLMDRNKKDLVKNWGYLQDALEKNTHDY